MLEVATFRAPHEEHTAHSQTSAHGMIVRDNIWGTIDQDALRRDFTINAMYYQPETGQILDFANGMKDIKSKTLRMIGDPATRYREDPVRMLRVARFAAKLQFHLDDATEAPIKDLAYLLKAISHHRLYDESHKMFACGHLQALLQHLGEMDLFGALFPLVKEDVFNSPLVKLAAKNTDDRIQQGKSVNPAFFYAVVLWEWQQRLTKLELDRGEDIFPAYQSAGIRVLTQQSLQTAIPRFVAQTIRDIWDLQPRLEKPRSRVVPKLIIQPKFRAGFDFLLLRELSGDTRTNGMGTWWEHYQAVSTDEQEALLRLLDKPKAKPKSNKPKKPKAPAKPKEDPAAV
jgi:poly(A) polymerase